MKAHAHTHNVNVENNFHGHGERAWHDTSVHASSLVTGQAAVCMALISRSGLELSTVSCVLPRGVFPMLYRHEPLATEYLDISLCELRSVNTRYLDIHTPGSFHTSAQFAVTVRFLASDVCMLAPPLPRTSGCHHNKVSPPPPLHTVSLTVLDIYSRAANEPSRSFTVPGENKNP